MTKRKFVPWSKKQLAIHQRLSTFSSYLFYRGYQLFFLTLTSPEGSDPKTLIPHFGKLIELIRTELGYTGYWYRVVTKEGNGVIHFIFAVKQKAAAFIDYYWLKEKWETLHGAFMVSVRRVGSEEHKDNTLRYIVNQYMTGQDVIVSHAYSYKTFPIKIARLWSSFKDLLNEYSNKVGEINFRGRLIPQYEKWPYKEKIAMWKALLRDESLTIMDVTYWMSNGAELTRFGGSSSRAYTGPKEYGAPNDADVPF